MNEPLTNSIPPPRFSGKSHNNHPHWYNQPLRLAPEELDNPRLVIEDFFECYHLHEVREILWNWLCEVISSEGSISTEGLERSNYIYFYEKLEALVEVAFILQQRKAQLTRQQRRKRKGSASKFSEGITDTFNKPQPLIERVKKDPAGVIHEVFKDVSFDMLQSTLAAWYQMAIASEGSVYDDADQREQLIAFYEGLKPLIEALHFSHTKEHGLSNEQYQNLPDSLKNEIAEADEVILRTADETDNPMEVITTFFNRFNMSYIRRELEDWLAAGIGYAGTIAQDITKLEILDTYRYTKCLIKSAYTLLQREKKTGAGIPA